ncbi:hypothetical protein [Myceligenerans pegani]|uniref:Uncharacterized protein n=1 Tax=Myceligenerans pegani TaxID=2776917 RepID=A0ABR9N370_9MICO|nr:hypothetical protein [Myceligenerans sp. TRM 65318]MBE1877462.1 hypothetical protein [Myceligenerans sp. TRM 65318]MBE3019733.1 hypothetical protein [Myceligenerans sp. TRM 65318]
MTRTADLHALIAQIRAAMTQIPPGPDVVVHAIHGPGHALVTCHLLTVTTGDRPTASHPARLPAAVGTTMRQVEHALTASGYSYATTDLGLRGAWRATRSGAHLLRVHRDTPDGPRTEPMPRRDAEPAR